MIILDNNELKNVNGGSNMFTAAFFNAAARSLSTIFDIGKSFGSAIRRAISGTFCPL